jgi:hypothetical protein
VTQERVLSQVRGPEHADPIMHRDRSTFCHTARLKLVVATDVTLGHGCSGPSLDEALQTRTTLSRSVSERGTHTLSVSSTPRAIMGDDVVEFNCACIHAGVRLHGVRVCTCRHADALCVQANRSHMRAGSVQLRHPLCGCVCACVLECFSSSTSCMLLPRSAHARTCISLDRALISMLN